MHRSAPAIAIATLLLHGAAARADSACATTMTEKAAGPATGLANDAREAMAAGKFDVALQLYEGAFCMLPDPALKHGLSSAALNLGRCEQAVRDARFWADHAAPKDTKDAVEWRDQVLHLCAEVTVDSTPAGAQVFLDGAQQPLGSAPWYGWLKAGPHSFVGRLPGFSDATSPLVIPEALNPPLTVTLVLPPVVVSGGPTPESRRAEAVRLAHEAAEAYKAGSYAQAFTAYEAAYKLVPAPPLVLNLSRTALKLGRCDEAASYALTYSAAFAGSDTASVASPSAWLASVYQQCPEIQITSAPVGASLQIAGQAGPLTTPWKGRLAVGAQEIIAGLAGFLEQRAQLEVRPGTAAVLQLALVPAPVAPAALRPPVPPAAKAPPPAQRGFSGTFVATLAFAGLAVVGVIVAGTEGATARRCPTVEATPVGVANAYNCQTFYDTVADVAWGVAGVSAVTAGALVFTWLPKSGPASETRVALRLTPTGIGASF